MKPAASGAVAVTRVLDTLMRDDRGRLLSALIAKFRDFQLAEDCLQDALISAVTHWNRNGLPNSPHGWLLKVAYRKAIDRIRQKKTAAKFGQDMMHLSPGEAFEDDEDGIPDERLRLIFTCCHPALEPKSQVALTLRTLGGLTTPQIARAFLDNETTMGQRLSRAKAKIAAAQIPYVVPEPDQWAERLQPVLSVIYLIFNAGYSAGPDAGADLAEEAIFLARMLDRLRPCDAEIEGCLALLLITHARRNARIGADGVLVPPGNQDRNLWQRDEATEGMALIDQAMTRRTPGPYQIKAAIAACHMADEKPDWPQIAALYDGLLRFEPTAVVRLNRAVAYGEAQSAQVGLRLIEDLNDELAQYQPFHAARAALLARCGKTAAALVAYDKAIAMANSAADVAFLTAKRVELAALVI
jgi:RNA polymerase sigma factor (sigma-70 family)